MPKQKKRAGRSEFSSPKAFQQWSPNSRNLSGSLANWFFVGSYWASNPAVFWRQKAGEWSKLESNAYTSRCKNLSMFKIQPTTWSVFVLETGREVWLSTPKETLKWVIFQESHPETETKQCNCVQLDCLLVRSLSPHPSSCCRGPISNPRPVLYSSAQTTRDNVLDFFRKT